MTDKADFNAEEWQTVAEAPMLAGLHVMAAARGGTIRETVAIGRAYSEIARTEGADPLIDQIATAPPALDPQALETAGGFGELSTQRLREALRIVGEKAAPDELGAYRAFVRKVIWAVAQVHKEGGFMGIGGTQVSDEEKAAIEEVEAVLDAA